MLIRTHERSVKPRLALPRVHHPRLLPCRVSECSPPPSFPAAPPSWYLVPKVFQRLRPKCRFSLATATSKRRIPLWQSSSHERVLSPSFRFLYPRVLFPKP